MKGINILEMLESQKKKLNKESRWEEQDSILGPVVERFRLQPVSHVCIIILCEGMTSY